jgi:hypothetical protein
LSCKFLVSEGMAISDLAPELTGCLRSKLGLTAKSPAQSESDRAAGPSTAPDSSASSSSDSVAPSPAPPSAD